MFNKFLEIVYFSSIDIKRKVISIKVDYNLDFYIL